MQTSAWKMQDENLLGRPHLSLTETFKTQKPNKSVEQCIKQHQLSVADMYYNYGKITSTKVSDEQIYDSMLKKTMTVTNDVATYPKQGRNKYNCSSRQTLTNSGKYKPCIYTQTNRCSKKILRRHER